MIHYRGQRKDRSGGAPVMVFNGQVLCGPLNPRFDLMRHSPDGFQWSYGGSGPAQLALALAADALRRVLAHGYVPNQTERQRSVADPLWRPPDIETLRVLRLADHVATVTYQRIKWLTVAPIQADAWDLTQPVIVALAVSLVNGTVPVEGDFFSEAARAVRKALETFIPEGDEYDIDLPAGPVEEDFDNWETGVPEDRRAETSGPESGLSF